MISGVQEEAEPGLASLVGGIAGDIQHLLAQQLTLLRRELGAEVRKVRSAALSLAVGAGVAVFGAVLLLLMAVHLLST